MPATQRTGFTDAYHSSRLNHLKNTAYPAALTSSFLALYIGAMPLSDGTSGSEATGTRPSITFGTTQTDVNGRQYIANSGSISVTLVNASAGEIIGFGICGAATGGTPVYIDRMPSPFQVQPNASITIPAGAIKVYAESSL